MPNMEAGEMSFFEETHFEIMKNDPKKYQLQKEDICGGCVSKGLKLVSPKEVEETEKYFNKAIRKLTQKYTFLNDR